MNSPDVDVISYLTTAGIVGGVTGWTGFAGYFPPTPDQCVAVTSTGGGPPEAGFAFESPRVQVRLRAARADYVASYTQVMALYEALHGQAISAEYPICTAVQDPFFMDYDGNERPIWVVNFQLRRTR